MSRTDKTAPWRVKALYYHEWVEEHHDHTDGVCNLPDRPTVDNIAQWGLVGGDCYWSYSLEMMYHPLQRCNCAMCGHDAYRSLPLRREQRYKARRYCRDGWRDEY